MTSLRVEPLPATLGAVVSGVSLGQLDDDGWPAIEAAFNEHAVLVFPAQHVTEDQQVAFARRFGPIETLGLPVDIIPITNQRDDGTLLEPGHPVMEIMRGNEGWHTDSSYMPLAAKASMLSAHVVPPSGGNTAWADMRAAYDALPEPMKERIEGLSAQHSIAYSQAKIGHTKRDAGFYGYSDEPPPLRPLVKVHPATGRKSLFIGRHAFGIPGLSESESEALLDDLLAFACQPPRVYEHRWEPGDLVVWDNRCVLHRARPYELSEVRVMKHTRIQGDPATEGAALAR